MRHTIMIYETIKSFLDAAISNTANDISKYTVHPDIDLVSNKKLPADKLLSFLICQGSSSTKNELLDFYSLDANTPGNSVFNQQRAKLTPEDLQSVFHQFNTQVHTIEDAIDYRFLAADSSTFTFFSRPCFASDEYFVSAGHSAKGFYSMHLNAFFDIEKHTYTMSFRIVRFPISDNTYECIVTNLPADKFPAERINALYFSRWGIESSFRKLKYTIGLSNFHAYKPEYIKQEIWAKLIAYNATEVLINHTVIKNTKTTKHVYKVNFSTAVHVCRIFLRLTTEKDLIDVMALLSRELIPIREERQYPRLQTAHFRKPRYFI